MSRDLLAETIRLLRECPPKERAEIATAIGVSEAWLKHLSGGRYQDPGVGKIQRLYEKLVNGPLL